jgi:hypothetical protein
MGYKIMSISQELLSKFQPRKGLEGPYFYPNGQVTYYDPKAGAYWDPTTDFYLSHEEAAELKNSVFDVIKA